MKEFNTKGVSNNMGTIEKEGATNATQETENQRKFNELVQNCMVDLSVEEAEYNSEALHSINGVRVFSRGNMSVIGGKAKSRKTFLVSLLCAEMLKSNPEIKIAIFDTEQSAFHVQSCTRRVHQLMDWDEKVSNERLKVFKLREYPIDERLKYFIGLTHHFKPDFVFLDGNTQSIAKRKQHLFATT